MRQLLGPSCSLPKRRRPSHPPSPTDHSPTLRCLFPTRDLTAQLCGHVYPDFQASTCYEHLCLELTAGARSPARLPPGPPDQSDFDPLPTQTPPPPPPGPTAAARGGGGGGGAARAPTADRPAPPAGAAGLSPPGRTPAPPPLRQKMLQQQQQMRLQQGGARSGAGGAGGSGDKSRSPFAFLGGGSSPSREGGRDRAATAGGARRSSAPGVSGGGGGGGGGGASDPSGVGAGTSGTTVVTAGGTAGAADPFAPDEETTRASARGGGGGGGGGEGQVGAVSGPQFDPLWRASRGWVLEKVMRRVELPSHVSRHRPPWGKAERDREQGRKRGGTPAESPGLGRSGSCPLMPSGDFCGQHLSSIFRRFQLVIS